MVLSASVSCTASNLFKTRLHVTFCPIGWKADALNEFQQVFGHCDWCGDFWIDFFAWRVDLWLLCELYCFKVVQNPIACHLLPNWMENRCPDYDSFEKMDV